jgi:hypothetical protein
MPDIGKSFRGGPVVTISFSRFQFEIAHIFPVSSVRSIDPSRTTTTNFLSFEHGPKPTAALYALVLLSHFKHEKGKVLHLSSRPMHNCCHPHIQILILLRCNHKPVFKPTLNHSSCNFLSVQSRPIIHPIFTFVNLVNKLRLFQRTWQLINHRSV